MPLPERVLMRKIKKREKNKLKVLGNREKQETPGKLTVKDLERHNLNLFRKTRFIS